MGREREVDGLGDSQNLFHTDTQGDKKLRFDLGERMFHNETYGLRMRKSKLDTPHIKKELLKRLAVGESQNCIAKSVGLDQSQVSRFANRGDIRAFIEQEQKRLLDAVPDAVENVKSLVREFKDIPVKETKRRELSYKASADVMKSVGLFPTPIQSQTFVNICNTKNEIISPLMWEVLRKYAESFKLTP